MVITHNMAAMGATRQLKTSVKKTEEASDKLGSGYRIITDKDDAAGLCISEAMRHQIKSLNRVDGNLADGIGLIQTADAALEETQNILDRMAELTTQAANDVNTGADRDAIQSEIGQLQEEIDRIANDTSFNGQYMLAAGTPKAAPGYYKVQAGALGGQAINIEYINASKESLGIADLDVSSYDNAGKSLEKVQNAISIAGQWRNDFGATQEKPEHAVRSTELTHENTQSAESKIRDTDMGEETVIYTRNQILVNAGQSLLAQFNSSPKSVAMLLQ